MIGTTAATRISWTYHYKVLFPFLPNTIDQELALELGPLLFDFDVVRGVPLVPVESGQRCDRFGKGDGLRKCIVRIDLIPTAFMFDRCAPILAFRWIV
jgi:hypothetical protein